MLETLLLKQSEIQELADMKEIIDYVETAYSVDANRKVQMPPKMYLFSTNTRATCVLCPASYVAWTRRELKM